MKQRRINATLTIAALALPTFLILATLPLDSIAAPRLEVKLDTFSCDDVTEIPQAECEALVALYNSTDGTNWSNNSGWLDTNTPCDWYGVTCGAGHVTKLSLGSNQVTGSIPAQLGNLTNLQDLYLQNNQLSGSIPPELGNLTNLEDFYLHINQLSGSIPVELGNLVNLDHLDLDNNQLSGNIPSELGNLTSLQDLYLQNNQLSGSIPPQLGNLTNLQYLSLDLNQLSGSIPPESGSLASLQTLGLSSNQLSGSIPPELGNLASLWSLHLSNNQLSGGIPPQLGNLADLQRLDLNLNQLSGSIPTELGNLASLRTLDLSSNQLSGNIPTWLGNLTDLQYLHLSINQLSGSIPSELGNLANLQYLYLWDNQLSDSIPPELGNLASLRSLDLRINQLSGSIPPELGNLTNLEHLRLNSNQFSGALPGTLTNLTNLYRFWFQNTDLCEPADAAFQTWLAGISDLKSTGVICPPTDKPPVVLVHGWQGLPGSDTRQCSEGVKLLAPGVVHTFGEMAQWFVDAGYDVWIASLDTGPLYTPPIEVNAQCLKNQVASVRQQTGQKVILVAHSMGGLVSRACLNLDECRDSVAALYTLGSPSAGINSAFLLKLVAYFKAPVAEELICEWQPALCQFTTDGMLWFNLFNPNRDGVAYSFIGGTKTPFPLGWLLLPFDGRNDGVVGSYSAVGWLYPTKLNVVLGPAASRYWTNETHSSGVGHPSYFEASGGPESQAFRCIAWGDCTEATTLALSVTQTEPTLSATTVDVVGHLGSGQSVNHTLQVDTSDHSLFYLSWLTGTPSFTLTQPDGQVITPAYADAHPDVVTYTTGLGDYAMPPFAAYAFTTTVPGLYTATITAGDVGITGTDYLLFAALETTRTFSISTDANLYEVGQTATFTGTLQGPWGGITGATVKAALIRSDGVTETLPLNDLGSGVYGATWTIPDAPGYLQATFTAVGDDSGTAFTRQMDELLAIAPYAAQLADTYADRPEDRDGDGFDDTLALDIGVMATQVGTYTLSADLVASGQTVAHALEYAVLATGTQTVTLGFDGWDIRRSRVDGPYTVTHVSLVDLGVGGIPAQIADDVWVIAAYDWQDFGFESLYLPLILRNH